MVLYAPVLLRPTGIQARPEYANPSSLLDVRVRKALARAVDSQGRAIREVEGAAASSNFALITVPSQARAVSDRAVRPGRELKNKLIVQVLSE